MKNFTKLQGKYITPMTIGDRDAFTVTLHSDASMKSNSRQSHTFLPVIGYGYCVELPSFSSNEMEPAYGNGAVVQDVNNSSAIAELIGILHALRETGLNENVEIVCDNTNAVDIANHVFSGVPAKKFETNRQMTVVLRELEEFADLGITARWVRGHAGNKYNHAVNMLARSARRQFEQDRAARYNIRQNRQMLNTFKQMTDKERN